MRTRHPSILFFAELLFFFFHITSAATNTDEPTLLEFKNRITQDPFGILSSWNASVHFCNWTGVTCDNQHGKRITKLDLQSHMLMGTLSPSIANLSFLTVLNLENNSFHGEIPREIGHLFHLQELVLANNSFSGKIPITISNCTNLVNLSIPSNQLVGRIPKEFGYLSKLVSFSVARNNLSGEVPASLGNLSLLNTLGLPYNNFEGSVPESLGRLTHLTFLGLGINNFSGTFPSSLYNISSITIFSIANNRFFGTLPSDIGLRLPNLIRFSIGMNQFSGEIPSSLFNASKLVIFDIISNNFVGSVPTNLGHLQELFRFSVASNGLGSGRDYDLRFLTSLTNCSKLGIVRISHNHFGGSFPNSITNLSTTLANLELGGNAIYGRIPSGIQNLMNLSHLSMEQNLLIGNIPAIIGKLRNLKILNLQENRFSGNIPSSLGNLTQLLEFYLANNKLQGTIPQSLQNCRSLQLLDLSQNNLNGTIPEQVIGLSSMSISLNLSHNSLTGSLPQKVGNMKNLGVLDISHNNLSGAIPNTLGDCLRLEHLHMESNFFEGSMPSSLSYLKGLQHLDLSHNSLSGEIPKYLELLSSLQSLNLSFNNFDGDVPMGGVFRNKSAVSIVGNSKLCGGVLELQLPPCLKEDSQGRRRSVSLFKVLMIVASVIVTLTVISSVLVYYWRRKSRRVPPSTPLMDDQYIRVSYDELFRATDGFNSTNLIGVGSFGSVYKGSLPQVAKPVAVKVLNLQRRGASKSFMAECRALRKICHRNLLKIVTLCSSIDHQGNDFKALVYQLMPNGSLESWLHPSKHQVPLRNLSFAQRLSVAIDVASAMNYLHHHCHSPLIHCDLKPSNVLLDAEFVAHVGDFGLAKFLSSTPHKGETSSIAIKGSIGYIAPEYAMGSEVSTRGDVYSYGILLLEMFTGKRPYDDIFKDGENLRSFCEMALSKYDMMAIVDPCMSFEEVDESYSSGKSCDFIEDSTDELLCSIIRLGLRCSADLPGDRMDIDDVVAELIAVKDAFLGGGMHVVDIK